MAILKGTEEPHDPVCFNPDGTRLDGRAVDELRPFSCRVGVIKNAQGSALVQHGGNTIIAAIYGPREVHPRHLAKPDRGILRVYYRMNTYSVWERKSPAPNRRENEISKVIREALEPVLFLEAYPDSQIEVYIQVIAADGGTRCASTTAASLALADAGIPMRSMVVGVAAGKAQGKVILDLGDKEDKVGEADVPAVVIMKTKEISLLQFDGEMSLEEMKLGFEYILKGAEEIHAKQIGALKGKYEDIQEQAEIEDNVIKQSIADGEISKIPDEPLDELSSEELDAPDDDIMEALDGNQYEEEDEEEISEEDYEEDEFDDDDEDEDEVDEIEEIEEIEDIPKSDDNSQISGISFEDISSKNTSPDSSSEESSKTEEKTTDESTQGGKN